MNQHQPRYKGRFVTKRNIQWRNNVAAAAKRRKELAAQAVAPKVEGQRIVNITKIAEDLWCKHCNRALSLRDIESETVKGLASIFNIRCQNCDIIKTVETSNRAKDIGNNQRMMFDHNCKAAMGIMNGAFGITQLNTFLSTLNLPPVYAALLKRYEHAVENANIEAIEKERQFDDETIQSEKELSIPASTSGQEQNGDPVL